jgi:hypothetical protein
VSRADTRSPHRDDRPAVRSTKSRCARLSGKRAVQPLTKHRKIGCSAWRATPHRATLPLSV